MKKTMIFCSLCLAALLLAACGAAETAQITAVTPVPTDAPTETPVAMVNPVHITDAEGLAQATGLVPTPPKGAQDVQYRYLSIPGSAPLAEMAFTLDGDGLLLRAQISTATEPDDISGLYYDWTLVQAAEVKGRRAVVYTNDEQGHIDWVDPDAGVLYNLSMSQGASAEKLTALAERVFAALLGEPEQPEQTPDPRYEAYRELVGQIGQGLERGWVADLVTERGISEVFKTAQKGEYGWLQEDINHDGTDELLLGGLVPEDEPSPIYDIYAMLNGEMIHPSTGWDYNHWYLLTDGIFVNEWHGSNYDTYRTAYGLFNGKLIPANRHVERIEYIHLDFKPFEAEEE